MFAQRVFLCINQCTSGTAKTLRLTSMEKLEFFEEANLAIVPLADNSSLQRDLIGFMVHFIFEAPNFQETQLEQVNQ